MTEQHTSRYSRCDLLSHQRTALEVVKHEALSINNATGTKPVPGSGKIRSGLASKARRMATLEQV